MVAVYFPLSWADGLPEIVAVPFRSSVRRRPIGRWEAFMAGTAVAQVVTVKLNEVPTVALAEAALVMIGDSHTYVKVTVLAEVPPGVVTVTWTEPAASAGELAVISVDETTETEVAGTPPNLTVAPLTKLNPVTVTTVPPVTGPLIGLIPDTMGRLYEVNWSAPEVAEVPPGVVTVTSTVPGVSGGELAVISVDETTENELGTPPKETVLAPARSVPVIVTEVPPVTGPAFGLTPVTTGTLYEVNWSALEVAEVPPGVVTVTSTVPADAAGELAVISVDETTETELAGTVPNRTVDPVTKPVPVMVTEVSPATGPALGLTPATTGTLYEVNWSALEGAEVPPGVVTVTSTVPADAAGELAVISVDETTETELAGMAPNWTVAPATKPVPVMVTEVPPATGPAFGLTAVTIGAPS